MIAVTGASWGLSPPAGVRAPAGTYTVLGMDAEPGIYLQTLTDLFRASRTPTTAWTTACPCLTSG